MSIDFLRNSTWPASRSEALMVAVGFSPRLEVRNHLRRVATLEDRGCVRSTRRSICGRTPRPIPKGLRPPAQGCEARVTLGLVKASARTPTGLRPIHRDDDTTPMGLTRIRRRFPKVARSEPDWPTSQPWALSRNPVGIRFPHKSL